jgi:cytochrome c oxidase subunit II
MRKSFFLLFILIFITGCSNEVENVINNAAPVSGVEDVVSKGDIREFSMIAKQWNFEPGVIEVDQGDMVKLSIESVDVAHGIAIPDFNVNVFLSPGKTEVVEFIADKSGEFTFFCSVQCGHGHGGMRGKLIVN